MEIEINFVHDWIKIMRDELAARGFQEPIPDSEVGFYFFNLFRRSIEPKPRAVHVSKEFSCPPEVQGGLDVFRAKVENGDDLRPHQSLKVGEADANDGLYDHWGIQHFHLGTSPHPKTPQLVARTGPVLFARIESNAAYFVDVMDHQNWHRQRLITILESNWPELLAGVQLKGISAVQSVSDEDIKKLRAAGINIITPGIGGGAFAPLGGGYSTNRTSTQVVIESDRQMMQVRAWEDWIRSNIEVLRAEAARIGRPFGDKVKFRLVYIKDTPKALEENSKIAFALP